MAILAGIDEAGFGPTLGPLIVSGVAFRVPDDRIGLCLWDVLQQTCTREVRHGARLLAITDSKRLYQPAKGLTLLERAALVMLAVGGKRPATWRELLDEIAPAAGEQLAQYPWYADADVGLPVSSDVGDVPTRANAVRRNAKARCVEPLGVFAEPLPEGQYNRLVAATRNKSVVLLGLALRVVDRIMRAAPDEHVRIHVDRLGGRKRYRESLTTALPGFELQIIEETDVRSAYRLIRSPRVVEIEFGTKGDSRHFPVAAASIYSKYLRELYMHAFNRFWCDAQPGLKPTAGYYVDAKRWLAEAAPAIDRLSVDRALLVRSR